MLETQKHPLDFDSLKKGDWIPQSELEKILNLSVTDPAYGFAIMALKEQIEDRTGFVVRQINNGIEMLTDSKAVDYLARCSRLADKKKLKSYRKLSNNIDISMLTPKQIEQYNHKTAIIGAEISASQNIRKESIISSKPQESPNKYRLLA